MTRSLMDQGSTHAIFSTSDDESTDFAIREELSQFVEVLDHLLDSAPLTLAFELDGHESPLT